MTKLVHGIGINDVEEKTWIHVDGRRIKHPVYKRWIHMLARCYSKRELNLRPTYHGCTVCEEWHRFSNFKRWMESQDWQGKQLDKDLLVKGNKIYSPDTCIFISQQLNSFSNDMKASRGQWPLGVDFNKRMGKFHARCCNPITKKHDSVGFFDCPDVAHKEWKKHKHWIACQLADMQTDERLAASLMVRYLD